MADLFDVGRYHELLQTEAIGRNFLFEPSVGSTMDVARKAAAAGAVDGTLVAADEQTSGRGRLGRSWVNPPGVNLASTLILKPNKDALPQIPVITPLAIVRAVAEVAGLSCGIKWPNDVVVDRGGHFLKLAGILIETVTGTNGEVVVFAGAGINVNWDPREHEEIRDIATSLQAELGRRVEREALLAVYAQHFEALYNDAQRGVSAVPAWKALLVTLGQRVHASWEGGSVEGTATDVDEKGALCVRTDDGRAVVVQSGDVTLRGSGGAQR